MEPHRKHQDGDDCFLRYLAKRIKALTKKLEALTTSASPTVEIGQETVEDPAHRRKQIEEEIHQFQTMREHYFNALARKDEKEDKVTEPLPSIAGSVSLTLAQLVVFGSLSSKDTVVRQRLNQSSKDQQLSFRQAVKTLFEVDPKHEGLPVHEIISIKAASIDKMLADKNCQQVLNQLGPLKFKSYSELRQEIVVEEAEPSESDEEGSSPSKKVLKDKNASSEEHPRPQQDYDGDEEIVTGESDCKNDSESDVKKKRFHGKKKNAAKKKYVEQQNYYASQQEQKHKKSHTVGAVNWRIRGDHEYDTDKQKFPEEKGKPAGG